MKWSLQQALGLSEEEEAAAELRAARLEEAYRPDGTRTYVPETKAGALFKDVKSGVVAKSDNPVINIPFRAFREYALK